MSEAASPASFRDVAAAALPDIGLAEETDDDLAFLRALYASTRRDGERIGRLYLKRGREELRLMDIALLPDARNAGLGTRLTRSLLAWADQLDLPVTLHVEPFNRACRLYQRLGFAYTRSTGVYHLLRREPGAAESGDLSSLLPPRLS